MFDLSVAPDAWRSARTNVDAAASTVDTARDAGSQALPDGAFGLMCSPLLLPAYSMVAGVAEQLLSSVANGLRETETNLGLAVANFENTEQEVADTFKQLTRSWE